MAARMTIGEFSQATRLSAKALRFYHRMGILVPSAIDAHNGYRLYETTQVADAQVVREFRALDVPVDTIREILDTPRVPERHALITEHLTRLEERLAATTHAVAALRGLLDPTTHPVDIEHRSEPALPALVIRERISRAELSDWYTAARAELVHLAATHAEVEGPVGGVWDTELFLNGVGEAALFVLLRAETTGGEYSGRIRAELLPAVELAVAVHRGPDATIAETYGALGVYVAEHEIGVSGPLRERYVVEATPESDDLVTEIGWPIFRAGR
ncbi:MerR family DNA-binding transcriptional regulator [Mycetocola tolaasinivorans]|uniref:MerR family DNA-binding transcriptional regulator n=1 Tax=Mycetocola tolaasinivorans TaxID=76635 RepID=A0A3L7ADK1_9MICO|nr:MerR family transcriptional regulator [Mycetocola tolaasinivorans]RLP77880.1 MerR family DNA-binding transcriptional regulator [Mycetocola tolaasinivorans]